jgi:hypothetical protein
MLEVLAIAYLLALASAEERMQSEQWRVDWDEMGPGPESFRVVHRSDVPVLSEAHDYHPGWDYEPVGVIHESVENDLTRLMPQLQSVADSLGLPGTIRVCLGVDIPDSHVARFVDGTESDPIIVLDVGLFLGLNEADRLRELRISLLHEIGHAYLRSLGIDYLGPEEEEVVELFARTADLSVLQSKT